MHIKRLLSMPLARRLRDTAELDALRSEGAELASQRVGACCSSRADLAKLIAPHGARVGVPPAGCHTGNGLPESREIGQEIGQGEQKRLDASAARASERACEGSVAAADRLRSSSEAETQRSALIANEESDARQIVTCALLLRGVVAALSDTPLQDVPYGWQAAVWSRLLIVRWDVHSASNECDL
jgi:hypothetical protein